MATAYDYPSAVHVARAGMDIVLIGDSVGMVELGFDTTQPVTMDHMIHHCAAVRRGVQFALANQAPTSNSGPKTRTMDKVPLILGDMPFGSYEFDDTDVALRNAYRFVQEGGADAIKMEVGWCDS
jgi:3-methyl-2-oxobutanoate hydroxymethyltransferase